ncbi:phosphate butyryltransferase [Thermotomaculum hydrothermale]|uniref:Phosphate butyryltransferase n=1 Tax=Thermotomaculum hydrothermale TaxID=981385 RepID=A0A7R6SZ36_9BACT|nr:phosphate acyltransferase [Thermotomaculum hydrothermale]BBB32415.1 phosphate butyryltransferase [Thermotomaculum hydrothermale]
MVIKNYNSLIETAKKQKGNKTVAVAMANESSVLKAVVKSVREGIVDAILVGNKNEMEEIASEQNFSLSGLNIIDIDNEKEAAKICVNLILEKKAHFLMKGFIKTSTLLKAVFKEKSLKERDVISHVAVLDIPKRDRLFFYTDGGIVEKPNKEQKVAIIENLISVAFSLGVKNPSFGFISPYRDFFEEENLEIIETIKEKYPEVTVHKALEPGEAFKNHDGLIVNAIEECNIVTKAFTLFTDTVFAGIIAGTKVPICLVSRSDTEKNKAASLALGAIFANRGE